MRKNVSFANALILCWLVVFVAVAAQSQQSAPADHGIFTPAAIQWKDGPAAMPPGSKFAVLEGDPAKEGQPERLANRRFQIVPSVLATCKIRFVGQLTFIFNHFHDAPAATFFLSGFCIVAGRIPPPFVLQSSVYSSKFRIP
jgi:hypothetical protein